MPSLCLHLAISRESFPRLEGKLGRQPGDYLFGSTLPDIHLMGGFTRLETHFVDIFKEMAGQEVERFFAAHPSLRRPTTPPLRARVAGYLCHLVVDSQWVKHIYHPYFGPHSPMGQDPMANLLDRTLQYELDRREREDREGMAAILGELSLVSLDGDELFDAQSLARWLGFVRIAAAREPGWERFPVYVTSYLIPQGKASPKVAQAFLSSLPQHLERVLQHVPAGTIKSFRRQAIEEAARVVEEWLC